MILGMPLSFTSELTEEADSGSRARRLAGATGGLRTLVCRAAQGKESGRVQRSASPYASRQRVSSGAGPCARRAQDTTSAERSRRPWASNVSRAYAASIASLSFFRSDAVANVSAQ